MLLKLFLTFFEIGAVSFGGGYGMISLIREKVLLHGWLSEAEFLSFIAVSESTPGPLAVNMATFIGSAPRWASSSPPSSSSCSSRPSSTTYSSTPGSKPFSPASGPASWPLSSPLPSRWA